MLLQTNMFIACQFYKLSESVGIISIHFFASIKLLGTAVAQLVEALRYKSEGRGFDSRWCHWNFSLT